MNPFSRLLVPLTIARDHLARGDDAPYHGSGCMWCKGRTPPKPHVGVRNPNPRRVIAHIDPTPLSEIDQSEHIGALDELPVLPAVVFVVPARGLKFPEAWEPMVSRLSPDDILWVLPQHHSVDYKLPFRYREGKWESGGDSWTKRVVVLSLYDGPAEGGGRSLDGFVASLGRTPRTIQEVLRLAHKEYGDRYKIELQASFMVPLSWYFCQPR